MPLKLELVTLGPDFSISATGQMPDVQVKVTAWERVPRGVRPSAFDSYVDNVVSKGDF